MEETEEKKLINVAMAACAENIARELHDDGYTYREAYSILQRVINYFAEVQNTEIVAWPEGPIGFNGKIIDLDK